MLPLKAKRILIVDDEATLAFFLKQSLQEARPFYQVEVAASGEEALAELTYNRYDLLVSDLKMAGITGFTLIERARSLQPGLKVILITAFGSQEVKDQAQKLKVNGYLTKPFLVAQLQQLINSTFPETVLASGKVSAQGGLPYEQS